MCGGLCERRGRGREYRLPLPASACGGAERDHGEKCGGLPGGKRPLHFPEADLEGAQAGAKAFEQCAGFLRVPESRSVLDNTAVHPESYAAAEKLLAACGYTLEDVSKGQIGELKQRAEQQGLEALRNCAGRACPLADSSRS